MKHTKEYAEKLAEKYAEDENSCYNNDLNSFKNGYMKAIEETNVKELLNQLNKSHELILRAYQYLGSKDNVLAESMRTEMYNIQETIKKATE